MLTLCAIMVLEIITLYKGEVSMDNLVSKHSDIIPSEIRKTISRRYKTVTKAINQVGLFQLFS